MSDRNAYNTLSGGKMSHKYINTWHSEYVGRSSENPGPQSIPSGWKRKERFVLISIP